MADRVVRRWAVVASAVVLLAVGQASAALAGTPPAQPPATGKPGIDLVSPAEAGPGASVSITGTNFANATSVKFGSVAVTAGNFTVDGTGTSITATVPATARTGRVGVVTPGGSTLSPSVFTVLGPSISAISGSVGPDEGVPGTTATINGTNLGGTTTVRIGGLVATPFAVGGGGTRITITVPSSAHTGKVTVTNAQGTATSPAAFTVPGPVITAVTGSAGVDAGAPGTVATITGTALTGTTRVRFGNTTAPGFVLSGSTQLTVTVPMKATSGRVAVTNSQGTGTSDSNFAVSGPMITSMAGSLGNNSGLPGTTATITGAALGGGGVVPEVLFGGARATAPVVNPAGTQILVTVPAGARTKTLTVRTPQGTGVSATDFAVPAPVLTAATEAFDHVGLSPTPLSGEPGETATVSGQYFGPRPVVKLGSLPLNGVVNGAGTQFVFTIPPKAKTGRITVTTPQGTVQESADFEVPAPQIDAVTGPFATPDAGLPGWTATIDGFFFGPAPVVKIGSTKVAAAVDPTGSQITFVVPDIASGRITVSTAQGSDSHDFAIPAPVFNAFAGQAGSGGLPGSTASIVAGSVGSKTVVMFGSAKASIIDRTDVGLGWVLFHVVVPSAATSGPIKIVTPRGTALSPADFVVGPVIVNFSPVSGTATPPGTLVTVNGRNLAGVTTVAIGGGAPFAPLSATATRLTFRIPATATTGVIRLTSPGGTATSTTNLTVAVVSI